MIKVTVDFYDGGYCTHPEFVSLKGGSFKNVKFPALCAVITHPKLGPILYDTGYSEHFYQATKNLPYSIYAKVTPVFLNEQDKVSTKIKKHKHLEIENIILSHFHADHIGGVLDFPKAQYLYTEASYGHLKDTKGLKALRKGFLPELLPEDFDKRSTLITNEKKIKKHFLNDYFSNVYDLFGDKSIIGVELSGHAKGQLGLYFETEDKNYFLIADSCFLSITFKELIYPSKIANFINDNQEEYVQTIKNIHKLYQEIKDIEIIPSHCGDSFKKHVNTCLWNMENLNTCNK